MQCKLIYLDD